MLIYYSVRVRPYDYTAYSCGPYDIPELIKDFNDGNSIVSTIYFWKCGHINQTLSCKAISSRF